MQSHIMLLVDWQSASSSRACADSSGDVVGTRGNGVDIGAAYMHIARNRMWNGGTTHWGVSWKQSIFEDNVRCMR
jgi:hypothetical protein